MQFPFSSKVDASALVPFDDHDTMFAALSADERSLDVIVTDYLTATEYMAPTPGVLRGTAAFTGEKLGIAVDKSRSDILAAINSGLNFAGDNYLVKDIIADWLAVPPEERPDGFVLNGGRWERGWLGASSRRDLSAPGCGEWSRLVED